MLNDIGRPSIAIEYHQTESEVCAALITDWHIFVLSYISSKLFIALTKARHQFCWCGRTVTSTESFQRRTDKRKHILNMSNSCSYAPKMCRKWIWDENIFGPILRLSLYPEHICRKANLKDRTLSTSLSDLLLQSYPESVVNWRNDKKFCLYKCFFFWKLCYICMRWYDEYPKYSLSWLCW